MRMLLNRPKGHRSWRACRCGRRELITKELFCSAGRNPSHHVRIGHPRCRPAPSVAASGAECRVPAVKPRCARRTCAGRKRSRLRQRRLKQSRSRRRVSTHDQSGVKSTSAARRPPQKVMRASERDSGCHQSRAPGVWRRCSVRSTNMATAVEPPARRLTTPRLPSEIRA